MIGCSVGDGSQKSDSSSTNKKLCANIIEEKMKERKRSSQDNFDIDKVDNAGFKMDYVARTIQGESIISEIELDDISSKVEC